MGSGKRRGRGKHAKSARKFPRPARTVKPRPSRHERRPEHLPSHVEDDPLLYSDDELIDAMAQVFGAAIAE
jgi:hypothetical protein